jgi:hypothetical protein
LRADENTQEPPCFVPILKKNGHRWDRFRYYPEPVYEARRSRFSAVPGMDARELARHHTASEADPVPVGIRCGAADRLGFDVQPGTVRLLGTFLADPTDVLQSPGASTPRGSPAAIC